MPESIPLHWVTDGLAYWVLFWSLVNIILPPREIFANSSESAKARYEIVLKLVAYYGALNLRQQSVRLYEAVRKPEPPEVT